MKTPSLYEQTRAADQVIRSLEGVLRPALTVQEKAARQAVVKELSAAAASFALASPQVIPPQRQDLNFSTDPVKQESPRHHV
jgi:hypothetical protein